MIPYWLPNGLRIVWTLLISTFSKKRGLKWLLWYHRCFGLLDDAILFSAGTGSVFSKHSLSKLSLAPSLWRQMIALVVRVSLKRLSIRFGSVSAFLSFSLGPVMVFLICRATEYYQSCFRVSLFPTQNPSRIWEKLNIGWGWTPWLQKKWELKFFLDNLKTLPGLVSFSWL